MTKERLPKTSLTEEHKAGNDNDISEQQQQQQQTLKTSKKKRQKVKDDPPAEAEAEAKAERSKPTSPPPPPSSPSKATSIPCFTELICEDDGFFLGDDDIDSKDQQQQQRSGQQSPPEAEEVNATATAAVEWPEVKGDCATTLTAAANAQKELQAKVYTTLHSVYGRGRSSSSAASGGSIWDRVPTLAGSYQRQQAVTEIEESWSTNRDRVVEFTNRLHNSAKKWARKLESEKLSGGGLLKPTPTTTAN